MVGCDGGVMSVDPTLLLIGTEHELRSVSSREIATQLAAENLASDPNYYAKSDFFTVPRHATANITRQQLRELEDTMRVSPRARTDGGRMAYTTAEDAARLLGLDAERTRKATTLISDLAHDTRSVLGVAKACREAGFSDVVTREVIARGAILSDRVRRGERVSKAAAAPDGTRSTHGGRKVIKRGGRWMPDRGEGADTDRVRTGRGATTRGRQRRRDESKAKGKKAKKQPPKGDAASTGEAPREVHPEVRARFRALQSRGKVAGIKVRGSLHPDHDHAHLDDLERRIAVHEKARAKYEGSDGSRKGNPPQEDSPPNDAEGSGEPSPGGKAGEDSPDGVTRPQGHTKPTQPHELHRLTQETHDLLAKLDEIESRAVKSHERGMLQAIRKDGKAVARDPSPESVEWLRSRVGALLTILAGVAAGAALGGPAGAVAGGVLAHNSTRRVAKAVFDQFDPVTLAIELDELVKGRRPSPEGTRSVHGGKHVIKRGGKWVPDTTRGQTAATPPKRKLKAGHKIMVDPETGEHHVVRVVSTHATAAEAHAAASEPHEQPSPAVPVAAPRPRTRPRAVTPPPPPTKKRPSDKQKTARIERLVSMADMDNAGEPGGRLRAVIRSSAGVLSEETNAVVAALQAKHPGYEFSVRQPRSARRPFWTITAVRKDAPVSTKPPKEDDAPTAGAGGSPEDHVIVTRSRTFGSASNVGNGRAQYHSGDESSSPRSLVEAAYIANGGLLHIKNLALIPLDSVYALARLLRSASGPKQVTVELSPPDSVDTDEVAAFERRKAMLANSAKDRSPGGVPAGYMLQRRSARKYRAVHLTFDRHGQFHDLATIGSYNSEQAAVDAVSAHARGVKEPPSTPEVPPSDPNSWHPPGWRVAGYDLRGRRYVTGPQHFVQRDGGRGGRWLSFLKTPHGHGGYSVTAHNTRAEALGNSKPLPASLFTGPKTPSPTRVRRQAKRAAAGGAVQSHPHGEYKIEKVHGKKWHVVFTDSEGEAHKVSKWGHHEKDPSTRSVIGDEHKSKRDAQRALDLHVKRQKAADTHGPLASHSVIRMVKHSMRNAPNRGTVRTANSILNAIERGATKAEAIEYAGEGASGVYQALQALAARHGPQASVSKAELIGSLRHALRGRGLTVVPSDTGVTLTGDLMKAGVPADVVQDPHVLRVDIDGAVDLIHRLERE